MKRLSYVTARNLVAITGSALIFQLVVEVSGVATRKPEFWWVVPALAAAFGLCVLYTLTAVVWNAWVEYRAAIKAVEGEKT